MSLSSGTRVGSYEVLAPIGAGGMGEVYRARDLKLEREVAIKFLPDAVSRDPARLARFEREAKVLASLNHPNIAQIYGIEDRALVMELVPGERLKGPLPPDTALNYTAQIAAALQAAHDKGIVHRDLKPANIMVTREGVVKLLDFGLAAQNREGSSASPEDSPTLTIGATQPGVIMGTAAYMSPEQASGQPVDRRSDIWSFGVVVLEMLTGERTFTGDTVSHILAAVLAKEPDVRRAPAKFQRLLKSCLQKDPRQRLQAIGDWKLLLDEDDKPGAGLESKNSSLLAWTLAAAALIAALGVSFLYFREPPPAPQPVRFSLPLPQKATLTAVGGQQISPDGRTLAFAAEGPDTVTRLYLRPLDSLEARPVPGTDGIDERGANSMTLAWSPDSRSLVFREGASLKKVDLTGAPPQTLCDCGGIGAAWNRDGVILIGGARGIQRVSAVGGGKPATVTIANSSDGERGHNFPVFLPDGRHFLYLRRDATQDGIYEGDLNASASAQSSQRLIAASSGAVYAPSADPAQGRILFLRGGTLMAQAWDVKHSSLSGDPVLVAEQVSTYENGFGRFSASANGTLVYQMGDSPNLQLTWIDRDGRTSGTVGQADRYFVLVLNRDGTKAGVGRVDASGKQDLWVLDLAQGTSTRLTSDPGIAQNITFSPDGSRVAFASVRGQDVGFFAKPSSGAGAEEVVLSSGASAALTEWTRDGRFLIFARAGPKTASDLWVVPMGGEHKPFPFLRSEFNEIGARLSPDGHWIAYFSNESGKNEIYVKRFIAEPDGGASAAAGKWLVSRAGGNGMIHWRNDGKELYYLAPDGKIMAVEVSTTGSEFHAGAPKPLFSVPETFVRRSSTPGNLADVMPDGKRFLFALPVQQNRADEFTVVLNWEAASKR